MKKLLRQILALSLAAMVVSGCTAGGDAGASNAGTQSSGTEQTQEQTTEDTTTQSTDTGTEQAEGEVRVLKIGLTATPTAPQTVYAEVFKEQLEIVSGGMMTCDIVAGGTLGNSAQLFSQLSEGTLDIFASGMDTATACQDSADYNIFSMPFAFNSVDHLLKFIESERYQEMDRKLMEANGVQLGGILGGLSPRGLNTKKPIASPSDLTNMKIRVPESAGNLAVWAAWGANPTVIAFSELYGALENGIVDGQDNDVPNTYTSSFFEVCPYYTEIAYIQQVTNMWQSTKTWNEMTDQQRAWYQEAVEKAYEINTANNLAAFEEVKQQAISEGAIFVEYDRDAFAALAAEAVAQFNGELFSDGLYDYIRDLDK